MAWSFDAAGAVVRANQSGTDTGLGTLNTAISAVATVARSTVFTITNVRKPPVANGMWYRCSTAGTSSATAPTYNATEGSTTTDGTSVWTAFLAPDVRTLGTTNHYYMPAFRFAINGTFTNNNPQQENFTCNDIIIYTGNFTSGAWSTDGVTPKWDGLHFVATKVGTNNADPIAFFLQAGAQFTFIGGEVQVAGAISFESNTTPRSYQTRWRNTKEWGTSSSRIRSYTSNAIFRDCEFFDIAYDLFRMPAEFSVKGRGCEYLAQYVGGTAGGADAKFTATNIENIDGTYDFDNYFSGWVELYNCKAGAALKVVSQYPNNAYWIRHCVPLYQDLKITAKDTSGVAVQNVRFNCTDVPTNSPTTTIVTVNNLKTWDFRNPLTYETTTNASGIALSTPVLNVWYWATTFKQNLRFPLSTAMYQGRAYNFKTMSVSVVLGASSVQELTAGMVGLDTATTVTEIVAGAITGISLVANGTTGGTITISSNHEYINAWNYYRWWISQFANKSSEDTWTCIGGVLDTKNWNIVVGAGVTLSSSTNISTLKTLGTLTNNGTITGVYSDSTGTSTVLTISGFGANSAVYVEDNNAIQKYFNADVTGSVVVYIPPTAIGSWYYAVEKFGNQRQSDFFTFSGGQKSIIVKDLPDNKILLTKTQTTALTSADNPDEAYDAFAFLRTGIPYISFGQIVAKDGATLYGADYSIVIKSTATNVVDADYDTKVITIKSTLFEAGPVCNLVKVDVPKTVTANTTESITVNIEDANGDSNVSIDGVVGSLVDVWKCANGTINADFATGTKIASNIGAGKFRFIGQSGFKLIFYDKNSLLARDCSMLKGTYSLGWFVFDSPLGGLNQTQASKFETIFSKVDVIDNNVVSVKETVEGLSASTGATVAEIDALGLAKETTAGAIKTKVDSLSNYNDMALVAKVDTIKTVADSIKTTVEDKTGYSLTNNQLDSIAVAVESHLLNEGDSQQLINAIVTAIGNSNIDETILVSAIRADLERSGGSIDTVKAKVDALQNTDFTATNNKIDAVKAKVDALNNADFTDTNSKIDAVKIKVDVLQNYDDTTVIAKIESINTKVDGLENFDVTELMEKVEAITPKLVQLNEGLQMVSNFEPYGDDLE